MTNFVTLKDLQQEVIHSLNHPENFYIGGLTYHLSIRFPLLLGKNPRMTVKDIDPETYNEILEDYDRRDLAEYYPDMFQS